MSVTLSVANLPRRSMYIDWSISCHGCPMSGLLSRTYSIEMKGRDGYFCTKLANHYGDVIMSKIASQITSLTIVYSTVYPGRDQRKYQSSASRAFVRGIHRWPVNSPYKGPVTRKMVPFDDVIMDKHNIDRLSCLILLMCVVFLVIFSVQQLRMFQFRYLHRWTFDIFVSN